MYTRREEGLDTVDADTDQGLPIDGRSYGFGTRILADLGGSLMHLPTVETPYDVRFPRNDRERAENVAAALA